MSRVDDAVLVDVPVFPLPEVVLFPESLLPLHVFEPRYRAMLEDCLDAGGELVIAQVDRAGARISDVAGVGVVVEHYALPDGRSNIVVAGAARVRLEELVSEMPPRFPYKRARARRLEELDVGVDDADRAALFAAATMFVAEVKKHDPSFAFNVPKAAAAGVLADSCAFQLVVDSSVKQAILEELDPRKRVRRVIDQLVVQHSAMLGEAKATLLN